jgi:hypothetical protein
MAVKAFLKMAVCAAVVGAVWLGCGGGGGDGVSYPVNPPVTGGYDGLLQLGDGVSYQQGPIPTGTQDLLSNVSFSDGGIVASGGSTRITIVSNIELSLVYIKIGSEPGYYILDLSAVNPVGGVYTYIPEVLISQTSPTLGGGTVLPISLVGVSTDNVRSAPANTTVRTDVVGSGLLQLALNWDSRDDVDLHVKLPNGNHVYFGRKVERNAAGDTLVHLDRDVLCSKPDTVARIENIYFRVLSDGLYLVYLHLYSDCSYIDAPFTLTASSGGRVLGSQYLNYTRGDFSSGRRQVLGVITVRNGAVVPTNYNASEVITLLSSSLSKILAESLEEKK